MAFFSCSFLDPKKKNHQPLAPMNPMSHSEKPRTLNWHLHLFCKVRDFVGRTKQLFTRWGHGAVRQLCLLSLLLCGWSALYVPGYFVCFWRRASHVGLYLGLESFHRPVQPLAAMALLLPCCSRSCFTTWTRTAVNNWVYWRLWAQPLQPSILKTSSGSIRRPQPVPLNPSPQHPSCFFHSPSQPQDDEKFLTDLFAQLTDEATEDDKRHELVSNDNKTKMSSRHRPSGWCSSSQFWFVCLMPGCCPSHPVSR